MVRTSFVTQHLRQMGSHRFGAQKGRKIGTQGEQFQPKVCRGEVTWVLPQFISVHRGGFDGRFRLVRTVKRTSFEDGWKIASPNNPFSAGDSELMLGFLLSKGVSCGEVTFAGQRAAPGPHHQPLPRRRYLKQEELLAHGTSNQGSLSVVAMHRDTLKSAELVLRES